MYTQKARFTYKNCESNSWENWTLLDRNVDQWTVKLAKSLCISVQLVMVAWFYLLEMKPQFIKLKTIQVDTRSIWLLQFFVQPTPQHFLRITKRLHFLFHNVRMMWGWQYVVRSVEFHKSHTTDACNQLTNISSFFSTIRVCAWLNVHNSFDTAFFLSTAPA